MGEYYTTQELMISEAAKYINNDEVCFIGTGLPMLASYLAKLTHAPDTVLIFESGIIGAEPTKDLPTGVADMRMSRCVKASDLFYALSLLQGGFIDLGFLGAAEIDGYGNINSTVIGDYHKPTIRLPGSGGANDIGSLARRTIVIASHQKRKFPTRLHYLTTPGYLEGGNSRNRAGLNQGGPEKIITDLCVFTFCEESKKMKVESIHPGVEISDLEKNTGFELIISNKVRITERPTREEVELIRKLDKQKIYLK